MAERFQSLEDYRRELAPGIPFVNFYTEGGNREIPVIPEFLESMEDMRVVGKGGSGKGITTFRFFDRSWDFLENEILRSRSAIRFSFGWVGSNTDAKSSIRETTVGWYRPVFSWQGNRLELQLIPKGNYMNREVFTRVFDRNGRPSLFSADKERAKVSDVAEYIASEMGLEADVEPTVGEFYIQQTNETNMAFLMRLTQLAQSAETGYMGYEVRIVDPGVLVFRPPRYQFYRNYTYARDMFGTMISFMVEINRNQITSGDYDNLVSSGHDVINKKGVMHRVESSTKGDATKREALAPQLFRTPPVKGAGGRVYVVPYTDDDQVKAFNLSKFWENVHKAVKARARIMGDPLIQPSDVINVVILKEDGDAHYTSGLYLITKVVNRISEGSFVTDLEMVTDGHGLAGLKNLGIRRELEKLYPPRGGDSRVEKKAKSLGK